MKSAFCLLFLLPFFCLAQPDSIAHGVYHWPEFKNGKKGGAATVFKGTTRDFSLMEMRAQQRASGKKTTYNIPENEELLLIVTSGLLSLQLKDSQYHLPPGSIALLMPGEKIRISRADTAATSYYTMQYRSKLPVDRHRGDTAGGSFVINWNQVPVKTNARGSRRDYFDRATALCSRFEMHITTLKEDFASHDPHRHPHEEIILNLDNYSEMLIGDKKYKGAPGDFYYLTSGIFHGIKNDGKGLCSYFAFRFE